MAFLLGVVSGLRVFTAPAVLWIMRHGGTWSFVLLCAAVLEYFFDAHPKAPRRTRSAGLVPRLISGAFVGYWVAIATQSSPVAGAVLGCAGALAGAYAGLVLRRETTAAMGTVTSGLLEDIIAITAAIAIIYSL
ncbi:MAG: hypothetical protein JO302_02720 [Candidatus Eremiobacteraeota bacterium]|nr:hypothetical protein [Candidatus Eremiobacteraeota bacterium]